MTKTTFLGLDVHAATIAIASLDEGQDKPEVWEIANDPAQIRKSIQRLKKKGGEVRCCYEAGPCGYVLHRQLTKLGIDCQVVAPSLIPRRPGDRVKTDRRDAAKLARLLRVGELTPIGVPTEEQEAVRDLVRAREDARCARSAARHRLEKFLLRAGLRHPGTNWTQQFWRWMGGLSFAATEQQVVFREYVAHVQFLDRQITTLDEAIAKTAQAEPFKTMVERLSCLRGISTLTAMVILAEIYDLRRFASARQFMAFLGLVPREHSSGAKQHRSGITKTGNAHVRRILVEAAWTYRHPPRLTLRQQKQLAAQPADIVETCTKATLRLGRRYRRLEAKGKRTPVVTTAIARELAGWIWGLGQQRSA